MVRVQNLFQLSQVFESHRSSGITRTVRGSSKIVRVMGCSVYRRKVMDGDTKLIPIFPGVRAINGQVIEILLYNL